MYWFSSKKDKKHIADVKTRTLKSRSLGARIAISALAISSGLVLATLLLWKGTEAILDRIVYQNQAFAIDQLDIQSDGIIPIEQVRRWAGVKIGDNLFKLDLHRVKRDLELVPLISTVSIERILPRRLNIRVIEREPIARMQVFTPRASDGLLESGTFYLDEIGVVMPPIGRLFNAKQFDAATATLPTLTGVSPAELRPGFQVQSQQILAALKWITVCKQSPISGAADVKTIELSAPGTLVVTTAEGSDITFSSRNFEPQIARWNRIHEYSRRAEKQLASLDLAVTNYIPIVWIQPDTNSAPIEIKPVKRTPYKKRHV